MKISPLNKCSTKEILSAFNLAFSDYTIPLQLTLEQLEQKIITDDIQLEYAVGAFEQDQLVGFILHGVRKKDGITYFYNAGTGVIPRYRGQRITQQLYKFFSEELLPSTKDHKRLLEVITTNDKAIKAYKKVGFKIHRTVHCYKGKLQLKLIDLPSNYSIQKIETPQWEFFKSFWETSPTWQNATKSLQKSAIDCYGIFDQQSKLVAYIITTPQKLRQIAVAPNHRNKGLAKCLIQHCYNNGDAISVLNLDEQNIALTNLLEQLGLEKFISQYEMQF
ncbi:MAG: GNAT family N-acetyltransferase [Aureispira sp.]|nr:GNAT family N-acetyltransferase [Aureispira sp.]